MSRIELTAEIQNGYISTVFGEFDANVKKIEGFYGVRIINRESGVKIIGEEEKAQAAATVLKALEEVASRGEEITEQNLEYYMQSAEDESIAEAVKLSGDLICLSIHGRPIRPKTIGQKKYIDLIKNNTVVFGVGPAGTGKTYLAMAMAITAFKNNEVGRIIMTRPAIEAGERLGFLPGDLRQKVDPYLRPLYDALYEIMGADAYLRNSEKGLIEVAPLAYMRGRTLDNAFIVLDEAQNTTPEQMKMFLTRIGFGSKAVITGDLTQIDLDGKPSGLDTAIKILSQTEDIGVISLTNRDVVRHPLVKRIIAAYDKYESKKQYEERKRKD